MPPTIYNKLRQNKIAPIAQRLESVRNDIIPCIMPSMKDDSGLRDANINTKKVNVLQNCQKLEELMELDLQFARDSMILEQIESGIQSLNPTRFTKKKFL